MLIESSFELNLFLEQFVGITLHDFKTLYKLNLSSYQLLEPVYNIINQKSPSQEELSQVLSKTQLQKLQSNNIKQHSIYNKIPNQLFDNTILEQKRSLRRLEKYEYVFWKSLQNYYHQRYRYGANNHQESKTKPKLSKKQTEVHNIAILILQFLNQINHNITKIIDLCAGRGYLSVFLALVFPDIKFILYDNNKRTQDRFETLVNILNNSYNTNIRNIEFRVKDISKKILEFTNINYPNRTLITGLHACGSATDDILDYSISNGISSFVIPCCHFYRKNIHINPIIKEIFQNKDNTKVIKRHNFRNLDFKLPEEIYIHNFLLGKFQNIIRVLNYYIQDQICTKVIHFVDKAVTPENMLLFYNNANHSL